MKTTTMNKMTKVAKKVGNEIKFAVKNPKTYFYLTGVGATMFASSKLNAQNTDIDSLAIKAPGTFISAVKTKAPAVFVRDDASRKLSTEMQIGQITYQDNNGTQQYTTVDLGESVKLFEGTRVSLVSRNRIAGNDYAKDFLGSAKPAGKTRTMAEAKVSQEMVNNEEGVLRVELGGNMANNPGAGDSVLNNWTMGGFGSVEGGSDGLMGKLMGGYETFGGKSGFNTAVQVTYQNELPFVDGEYKVGVKEVLNEIGMNNSYGFKLDQSTTPMILADITVALGGRTDINVNVEAGKFSQNITLTAQKMRWNLGVTYRNYNNLDAVDPINYNEIKATISWKY